MAERGATDLSGILAVDKPKGMTSHDVVSAVRRATGEKRVGHAGTLDPMATGVLVVLVGPATRLAPHLTAARKTYDARIVFGSETDTDDAEGTVTRTEAVPPELATEAGAIAHVVDLVGTRAQVPPAFSAIKQGGKTAHRAARAGEQLTLEPREIEVVDAVLLGVEPGPPIAWNVTLAVSKGTYIRAIARDLGRDSGTAAHLAGLRRTASGEIPLRRCTALEEIERAGADAAATERIAELFVPAIEVLGLPVYMASAEEAARVADGRPLPLPDGAAKDRMRAGAGHPGASEDQVAIAFEDRLRAIYTVDERELMPSTVIPGGVA